MFFVCLGDISQGLREGGIQKWKKMTLIQKLKKMTRPRIEPATIIQQFPEGAHLQYTACTFSHWILPVRFWRRIFRSKTVPTLFDLFGERALGAKSVYLVDFQVWLPMPSLLQFRLFGGFIFNLISPKLAEF